MIIVLHTMFELPELNGAKSKVTFRTILPVAFILKDSLNTFNCQLLIKKFVKTTRPLMYEQFLDSSGISISICRFIVVSVIQSK